MAKDLGSPPHSSVTKVKVEVARNSHAPVFSPASYAPTIDFNRQAGSVIQKVTARDDDDSVSIFFNSCRIALRVRVRPG